MSNGLDVSTYWFAARLLLESSVEAETSNDPLIEERIVLFRAASIDAARDAAEVYGRGEDCEYPNEAGQMVTWRLKDIQDLSLIEEAPSEGGWDVLSRFLRLSELPIIKE